LEPILAHPTRIVRYLRFLLGFVSLFAFATMNMAAALRIAVVTGANKGIGLEIARKFGAAEDTLCILTARNADLGSRACEELAKEGLNVVFKQLDIDDSSSVEAFATQMEEEYGKIDTLVNNAAIAFKAADPTPFSEQAEPTVRVNYFGTARVLDALLPLVRRAAAAAAPADGGGRVVNVASSAGALRIFPAGSPWPARLRAADLGRAELDGLMNNFVAAVRGGAHAAGGWPSTCYGMSKCGVIALTKILAREEAAAGSGVLINSVHPGYCVTDMTSQRGSRSAEEGARTPFLLGCAATLPGGSSATSGGFWFDEQEQEW